MAPSTRPARKAKSDAEKLSASSKNARVSKASSKSGPKKVSGTRATKKISGSFTEAKLRAAINKPLKPSQDVVDVFVFGSGAMCELGLGPFEKDTNVKRPRLNKKLAFDEVGVVAVAAGGAHSLAIDRNGRVWSWGQNDAGALGRDTKLTEEEEDEDDYVLNIHEATPAPVADTIDGRVVSIAASDNLSVAVTEDGRVFAWGTFIDDGHKLFRPGTEIQRTPIHIPQFKYIVKVVCGKEHVVALDTAGNVFSWGVGSNGQLGAPLYSGLRTQVFGPFKLNVKKVKDISSGEYHSFAITHDGAVYSWGLNNEGQCGFPEEVGANSFIETPTNVTSLEDKGEIVQIAGGAHHTLVLNKAGEVYSVGQTTFGQLGLKKEEFPPSTVYEEISKSAAYVPEFTKIGSLPKIKFIATGTDHSIAITADEGYAMTWGFGDVYQLGLGEDESEDIPTKIDNTATRGVNLNFAAAGGQFSILTAPHIETKTENGVANGH